MIKIAITGHRFLAEEDRITASIKQVARRLLIDFPREDFSIFTCLAEGADRLAARILTPALGARMVAVLPMSIEDYSQDFSTPASQLEFEQMLENANLVVELTPKDERSTAYEAGNHYLLHHCDLLLAIWDGQPAQGSGGAGELVENARCLSIPLAWIKAGNRLPGTTTPTSLGESQGKLVWENYENLQVAEE